MLDWIGLDWIGVVVVHGRRNKSYVFQDSLLLRGWKRKEYWRLGCIERITESEAKPDGLSRGLNRF